MGSLLNVTGQRYGKLIAISRTAEKVASGGYYWLCKCDCGNDKIAKLTLLRNGHVTSCGCAKATATKAAVKSTITHGDSNSRFHILWKHIKSRCYNPNDASFANYGGRGIQMQKSWVNNYVAFRDYVAALPGAATSGLTLDRVNNGKGYKEGNLRWATAKEQALNRRTSIKVMYRGKRSLLSELCEERGLPVKRVRKRLITFRWPLAQALEDKPRVRRP